jgi:small subunit ribosomal protein S20
MPQTKSAKKTLRVEKRRKAVNLLVKEKIREAVKMARQKPTATTLQKASSILDQAVKKEILHKNKASRLKKRLSSLLTKTSEKSYTKDTHAQRQNKPTAARRLRKKATR